MDIAKLSDKYHVKKLINKDIDAVLELCSHNHIFYQFHPPLPSEESILEDMEALPSGKDYSDKFYIGFWEQGFLVAVMDLILSYPNENTAFIGFFMVDASVQRSGIGSGILSGVLNHLKNIGYLNVLLGIDRGNPQSEAFWTKNGFQKTGTEYNDESVSYLYMGRYLN